ncbi:hypothetical protein [Mesorhizobium sp. 2RAF21]|uniref:hypothetical protein n=1 Tax=Mesorhizobium sp. 2RAF21 TaxID=3232995 RepID=UPI003F991C34
MPDAAHTLRKVDPVDVDAEFGIFSCRIDLKNDKIGLLGGIDLFKDVVVAGDPDVFVENALKAVRLVKEVAAVPAVCAENGAHCLSPVRRTAA